MPTRKIWLLTGKTVKFSDLPSLLAEALHDNEDTRAIAELEFEDELKRMVNAGTLTVRNPTTLGEQAFPLGNVLANSVLTADDLRPLLEEKGISIETARQTYDRLLGQDFLPAGTYLYADALHDIAQAQGWEDVRRDALEDAMWKDINTGVLPTYDYQTGLRRERGVAPDNTFLLVTPDDVNQWLESRGAKYKWVRPEREAAIQTAVAPTPVAGGDETPKQRRARWLSMLEEENGLLGRGALARVHRRELQRNPKADRSYMGKQIKLAEEERRTTSHEPTANNPFGKATTRHVDGKLAN